MAMVRDDQPRDEQQEHRQRRSVTRRGFLSGIGAGAAGAAGSVALPAAAFGQSAVPSATRPDRFSRLFPNLRPFADPSSARVHAALRRMGEVGGLMDAKDDLSDPVLSITDPKRSITNPDSGAVRPDGTGLDGGLSAGMTFLGQFLDHDMTFDAASRLGVPTPPERSPNSRTPVFDLDSVYGGGPTVSPQLYASRSKFKVESGGPFEDLPRTSDNVAIIGDRRNDENLIIAGLHVALLKFHNNVVDLLVQSGDAHRLAQAEAAEMGFAEIADVDRDRNVFAEARRIVTWHYQWIIVHEFLPAIVGASLVNDILSRGRRFYRPEDGEQSIPVEFQMVYRFGHSLVRPSYRANLAGDVGGNPKTGAPAFFGFVFDPAADGEPDPRDLRGGARAPRRFIGWQTFFNFGVVNGVNFAQHTRSTKMIDTNISSPLFRLPLGAIASGDPPISLPQRNLLRHLTWSIPSGQDIARAMRITPLPPRQFSELRGLGVGFDESTPLWYYILKEAELAGGRRLAGVGARLVAEVFLGLLQLDRQSYFRSRNWRPTLPSRVRGRFTMVDLLTFAGVDPVSRNQ